MRVSKRLARTLSGPIALPGSYGSEACVHYRTDLHDETDAAHSMNNRPDCYPLAALQLLRVNNPPTSEITQTMARM